MVQRMDGLERSLVGLSAIIVEELEFGVPPTRGKGAGNASSRYRSNQLIPAYMVISIG